MTLEAKNVSWTRGGNLVVDGVSLIPGQGETVGLLGPNGSGKSSLLRLMYAAAKPDSGAILLDGENLSGIGRREVARRIATVTQHAETDADITVYDVVRLGRIPHRKLFGENHEVDDKAILAALEHVGLVEKAERHWHALSGGEQQRAHIARALAQEPQDLLLDEPTNHLDIRHQLELLKLVTNLPVTSIIAIHDLNLAAMFCDSVMVLNRGKAVVSGSPEEVLTPSLIREVYGVNAEVSRSQGSGRLSVTYSV